MGRHRRRHRRRRHRRRRHRRRRHRRRRHRIAYLGIFYSLQFRQK